MNLRFPVGIFLCASLFLLVIVVSATNDDDEAEKTKQTQEKVKPILEKIRQKMKAELAEVAKKQKDDVKFQKMLKEVMDVREKHKGEEKEGPKSMAELNSEIMNVTYQCDMMLTEEQANAILAGLESGSQTLNDTEEVGNPASSQRMNEAGEAGSSTANQTTFVVEDVDSSGNVTRRRRAAAINVATYTTGRWPNAIVPYIFASDVPDWVKSLMQKAMAVWQSKTCLTFQLNSAAPNKLYFTQASSGCWSWVGRLIDRSQQEVNIGAGCESIGTIEHEIGHALGSWHEQSRYDRDTYVYYDAANVEAGREDQFTKETTDTNNNYGLFYDYGGVMHYAGTDFSSNGQPVLLATLGVEYQRTMGQRLTVSFYDFKMINALYNCKVRCTTAITCKCGGFQNPRNCAVCACPPGWGGTECTVPNPNPAGYAPPGVPNTCTGNSIKAQPWAKYLSGQIGTTDHTLQNQWDYARCHWYIYADPGYKIAIEVLEVGNYCTKACRFGNTEIRLGKTGSIVGLDKYGTIDWGRTGVRLCCTSDLGSTGKLTLTTAYARAMISLYAVVDVQRFKIRFWQYAA